MKKTLWMLPLAMFLGLSLAPVRAAAAAQDTLTLKDGRVVQGQILDESADTVVVLVDGVKRSFGRNFIAKLAYGTGAGAPVAPAGSAPQGGPAAAPEPPAGTLPTVAPSGDLVRDLSVRYRVPAGDVVWVRNQGIPDKELSMVFLVAATVQVTPRTVVRLRKEGYSWNEIENHFGMDPDYVYYSPGPWAAYPYYYYPGVAVGWGWGWGWGGRGWGWGGHGWGRHWR